MADFCNQCAKSPDLDFPPGDFAGLVSGTELAWVLCEGCGQILVNAAGDRVPMAIAVWRFQDAPAALQAVSTHGGDEDWLAEIPPGMEAPMWMNSGTPFGCCDVTEHEHPTAPGWTVCIGAHA